MRFPLIHALLGGLLLALAGCGGGGGASGSATLALTVAVAGPGRVDSQPMGIDCGGACSARFEAGTTITLTARSDAAATFSGWGGACTGSSSTCTVSLSEARSVTATFLAGPRPMPWSPATALSASGADRPRVALDAAGNATAVWLQRESPAVPRFSVWSSRRPAGGAWSSPERLDSGLNEVYVAEIAVDTARGRAFAIWAERRPLFSAYTVWVRATGAGGQWGPEERMDIGGRQAAQLRVGVDANGNAVTSWNEIETTNTWTVWARRYDAAAGWGPTRRVAPQGAQDLRPYLAVAGNGDAFVLWHRQGSGIWASRSTQTGIWSPAVQLASGLIGVDLDQARIVATPGGQALAVWSRGSVQNGAFGTRLESKRFSNGAWAEQVEFLSPALVTELLSVPVLAANAGGDLAVAWGLADGRVFATRSLAGGWTAPAQVRPAGGDLRAAPALGLDAQGQMFALWAAANASTGGTELSISRFTPAEAWSSPTLHDSPPHGSDQAQIAMNARGDAVTAWVQTLTAGSQIVSRSYSAGP